MMLYVINKGELLEVQHMLPVLTDNQPQESPLAKPMAHFSELAKNIASPIGILLIQVVTVVFVSRAFGSLFKKIHQPMVIGEIIAGIALGPSLLGHFLPQVSHWLFPPQSLSNLQLVSDFGLILFMFVIGMELDTKYLRQKAREATFISHASIVFPFFLGVVLAYFIYSDYTANNVAFMPFALFIGISMSITAFPVLARIVQERGLTKTALGNIALTCAAIDDLTAWCLLAIVVAIVKAGNISHAVVTIGFSAAYLLVMVYLVRPVMRRVGSIYTSKENMSKSIMAVVFLLVMASSFATEAIGIHALFGAFMAGIIMPQNLRFKQILTDKVEDVSIVLLLPLFFVATGLHTQIGLLGNTHAWLTCGAVIAAAVVGKFGGSAFAARVVGQSWRNSLSIGALMNTRGLIQLIVLNIGYDLGILSPQMFAIMVLMAIVTTFMTGPSLHFIDVLFKGGHKRKIEQGQHAVYRVLMSFGRPQMGGNLMKLAYLMGGKEAQYTAMHITPSAEIHPQEAIMYEKEAFRQAKATAQSLGLPVETYYKATGEVGKEIVSKTERGQFDLLLVGAARSVFGASILGGKIRSIIDEANCTVGVFADRNFNQADSVLVVLGDETDQFLLEYVEKMLENSDNTRFTLMIEEKGTGFSLKDLDESIIFAIDQPLDKQMLKGYDLVMVSIELWQKHLEKHRQWLEHAPSVLIMQQKGQ